MTPKLTGICMIVVSLLVLLAGCTGKEEGAGQGKLKVVASFYPLYDFARNVGGDRVEVSMLIPGGIEPHEFEPTASDIRKLADADIFLYNGADMEPWAERVAQGSGNPRLMVVDTSEHIQLLEASGEHHHDGEEGGKHHHDEEEGGHDPHIWLDPTLARVQVQNIESALITADPAGKDEYERNAAAYIARLDALDARIREAMSDCDRKDILITHATLGYFCKRYGCNQIAITGVDPEAEPSPADLAAIIDQAKEKNVSAVFFESMIDPRSAETISREINGTVLQFNSVHGLTDEERAAGEDYISLMEGNIINIEKGLGCR